MEPNNKIDFFRQSKSVIFSLISIGDPALHEGDLSGANRSLELRNFF
jgi:hypothetical protein